MARRRVTAREKQHWEEEPKVAEAELDPIQQAIAAKQRRREEALRAALKAAAASAAPNITTAFFDEPKKPVAPAAVAGSTHSLEAASTQSNGTLEDAGAAQSEDSSANPLASLLGYSHGDSSDDEGSKDSAHDSSAEEVAAQASSKPAESAPQAAEAAKPEAPAADNLDAELASFMEELDYYPAAPHMPFPYQHSYYAPYGGHVHGYLPPVVVPALPQMSAFMQPAASGAPGTDAKPPLPSDAPPLPSGDGDPPLPAAGGQSVAATGTASDADAKKRKRDAAPAAGAAAAGKKKKAMKLPKSANSLINKWQAVRKDLVDEEDEDEVPDPAALERKRLREAEEWRLQQLRAGATPDDNANFQPVAGDWRSKVQSAKKRGKADAKEAAADSESPAGSSKAGQKPDLDALSKGLPAGWRAMWDKASGDVYYGNLTTKATSWERPA
ncbi:hypothetical protein WJX72_007317 [[Myrmecia] bisecta]|uniref:WW domain-containing protein n=1 Tax=[Myrmecia] bisecta TaxID=41462 RepID=A0AAW1QAE5_9CHLO